MLQRFKPYLFLLFIAVTAYWQIAFLHNAVKWDMLDCILPWRYFMGECLQNNVFPLWNPYQAMGYPFHADLQVPVWSPEAIVYGYFTVHSLYSLHFLFVAYVFFAGIGMFLLTRYFTKTTIVSLIIGSAYMLSGFFVAHVQHFNVLISAAYIPWLILYFVKILNEPSCKNALKTSLFFFLLVTSGYQTFTILTTYFLFFITTFYFFLHYRNKQFALLLKTLRVVLFFAFVTLLLCLPIIISFIQVKPYVDRFSKGLSYADAISNPFSPQSLLSFVSPFSAVRNSEFFKTDLSMCNSYFGIIILVLLLSSLIHKKSFLQNFSFGLGILCLLTAMGDYLPLFKLSRYLPMLGVFRLPSYYSFYATFIFFMLAAFHLNKIINEPEKYKKSLLISTGFTAFILICLLSWAAAKIDFHNFSYFKPFPSFSEWIFRGTVYENTFLYLFFQLTVLGIFVRIIYKSRKLPLHLLLLIAGEMLISVQLNIYKTGISADSTSNMAYELQKQPKGFPKPNLSLKVKDILDNTLEMPGLWRNTNIFFKKVSAETFSSFNLKGFDNIRDQSPNLFKAITNNSFVYLSDKVFPVNLLNDSLIDSEKNHLDIYLDKGTYEEVRKKDLHLFKTDTLFISSFLPNEIVFKSRTKFPVLINLLQSDYPGWKIFIDNKETNKLLANTNFISAMLPEGLHQTRFVYENNTVLYSASFSYGLFFIVLLFVIGWYYKEEQNKRIKTLILFVIIFSFLFTGFRVFVRKPYIKAEKEYLKKTQRRIQTLTDSLKGKDATVVFNTDADNVFTDGGKNSTYNNYIMRFDQTSDITKLYKLVQASKGNQFIYAWLNLRNPDEVEETIRLKYPRKITIYNNERSSIALFVNDKNYKRPYIFYSFNDFESKYENWSYNESVRDTITGSPFNLCNKLDSGAVFSSIYEMKVNDAEKFKDQFITINADIIAEKGVNASIIFSIERDQKPYVYFGQKLEADNINWVKNIMVRKIDKSIQAGDMIRIYIWSVGKSKVNIDNFLIACYKE